ncbi:MAG: tetratricopeptide repeat protein [Hamadaea sp.]|nr:tetratricopeptide repeat protein [Hamadaea sp.]
MTNGWVEDDLAKAQNLIDIGRAEDARRLLRRILAEQPQSYLALCTLAQADHEVGDFDAMLTHADAATAALPEAGWAHRLRSVALAATFRFGASVDAARTATSVAPSQWQSHTVLADSLLNQPLPPDHDVCEGFLAARRAVELAPAEPRTHIALGLAYAKIGDRRRAGECFATALSLDPLHVIARNNLAAMQLQTGRYTAAGQRLVEVLADDPHFDVLHRNLVTAANGWWWRRAEYAAFSWLAAFVAALLRHGPVERRATSLVILALVVAANFHAYRGLPRPMRRLVAAKPDRTQPGRLLAVVCVATCLLTLLLQVAVPPVSLALAPVALILTVAATAQLRHRPSAELRRTLRRWRYRRLIRRAG